MRSMPERELATGNACHDAVLGKHEGRCTCGLGHPSARGAHNPTRLRAEV